MDFDKISSISTLFSGLCVSIPKRKNAPQDSKDLSANRLNLNDSEILDLLKRRPLEANEVQNMLSGKSFARLQNLLDSRKIQIKRVGLIEFYVI